jgi:hypothetical protein
MGRFLPLSCFFLGGGPKHKNVTRVPRFMDDFSPRYTTQLRPQNLSHLHNVFPPLIIVLRCPHRNAFFSTIIVFPLW